MINRILVPTDFSKAANNALKYALKLAHTCNAEVHLLHVISIPVADAYFTAGTYLSYLNELEASAKDSLREMEARYYKSSGIKFHSSIVMGSVYDEIHQSAQKNKTDLIVMGTTGASGLSEILIGSHAASIVSRSTVPVLVIPPSAHYHKLKHIVYATDYNEPEFPAISRLVYLAQLYDAQLTVLHARSDYDRYFNSENNFFVKNRDRITYNKLNMEQTEGPVMESINGFVKDNHADMVVVAKHNRSFFDRIFHRSLSKRMAYHTEIPLLVLDKNTVKNNHNPVKRRMMAGV